MPMDVPSCGLVAHSGEIQTTGKSHKKLMVWITNPRERKMDTEMPTSSETASFNSRFFPSMSEKPDYSKGTKEMYISLFTRSTIPLWHITDVKQTADINDWKWSFGKRGGPKFETALNVLAFESLLYVELRTVDRSLGENCNWSCDWKINTRTQHIQPRDNGINTECSVSVLRNAPHREACKVSHPFSNERNLSATRTHEMQKGLAARYPEAF